jgi:6-phosphogluconate dehydrogenase
MNKQQIGVIGIGVMGKNLALNIESRGFSVAVYDRIRLSIDNMVAEAAGKNIVGTYSLQDFAQSLEAPRKIIIMIKAGSPVDDTIDSLKQYISKGDIIIDCGNSFYKDTIRRSRQLEKEGYIFIGSGVSGGEEGALHGPSLMPGGPKAAYKLIEPIFTSIAAKVDNQPCCTHIGTDGAGHYVKMVHNGIEYGDMQLICEAYSLLKEVLGLTNEELYNVFSEWNKGELDSYLIEITRDIFKKRDEETGKPILDIILDAAGQKGTGKWGSQSALNLGVSTPTITEAVFARCLSAIKEERVAASEVFKCTSNNKDVVDKNEFIEAVRQALYASKICSYAQGFALMKAAAKEYGWDLNYGNIAMIFRGGCIIRAQFLNKIKEAYDKNPNLSNLMLDTYFSEILLQYQEGWRKTVSAAVNRGVPVPAFSSAISYFDSYKSERLSANLLQAQRDYFGAHTYERVDKPRGEIFHTNWTGHGGATTAESYNV